jgi:hypothetical protein
MEGLEATGSPDFQCETTKYLVNETLNPEPSNPKTLNPKTL